MLSCRWKFLFTAAAFLGAVGLAAPPVGAVHLSGLFELDGNTVDPTPPAPNPPGTPNLPDDWNSLYNGGANDGGSPVVFTGIEPDRNGVDDVFTGGGSKDTRDSAPGGVTGNNVWQWKTVTDASPPKDDITNAYAAAYLCDAAAAATGDCNLNDLIIYFGLDRFKTDGVAQMGFWFFNFGVSPLDPQPNFFSDIHGVGPPGDTLVLVEVAKGGTQPNIKVFEWVGSGGDGKHGGTLNTIVAPGSAKCSDLGVGDLVCAETNAVNTTPAWPYLDDDGNTSFQPQAFFEGGVNVTQLLGGTPCLAAFQAETRSSGAPLTETAQLKDFVNDDFPLCGVSAAKACIADPAGLVCEDGSSCTEDADCITDSPFSGFCVDENPFIDDDGVTTIVQFDVDIINTGFGPLFDPVVREDIAYVADIAGSDNTDRTGGADGDEECFITETTTDTGTTTVLATPVFLSSGSFVELDQLVSGAIASIGPNLTASVEITCDTPRLELANIITAGANTEDEDDASRLTEQFAMTPQGSGGANTCPIAPEATALVTKDCLEVRLMANASSELVVETIVEITIENDGDEALELVDVDDDQAGSITSGDTLAPGEMKTFRAAYMPSTPTANPIAKTCQGTGDVGESCTVDADCLSNTELSETGVCLDGNDDKFVPSSAMFMDTAGLVAVGVLSGDVIGDGDTNNGGTGSDLIEDDATCPLCPAGEICTVPVCQALNPAECPS